MILDCLYESFKNIENELRASDNQKIKSSFIEFDSCMSRNRQTMILQKMIETALMKTIVLGVWSQLYFEDKIIEQFDYLLSHFYESHQTITVKVSFQDYPKELYRIIKLPYMIKLDELCYGVLASLRVQECKQFSLELNHEDRYGCGQEIGDNEIDQLLSTYSIDKNSLIKLYYDFDKTYSFDIEVLKIEDDYTKQIEVIEGKGYGIWENGLECLKLYYRNRYQFIKFIDSQGLDIYDFFVESFDFIYMNKHMQDDLEVLKIKYNIKYEERKLFYEYLPFSLHNLSK